MYCLMCQKSLAEGTFHDVFIRNDLLCEECRNAWRHQPIQFQFENIPLRSDYMYNEAFSKALIQFKECYDEALCDVFLYEIKKKLKRIYRGYTLCLLPSAKTKMEQRGFSHLQEIFQCLGLDMLEPFEKMDDIDQKKASYQQRQKMKDDIRCIQKLPKKIVLCDDTITTGSTLKGCLKSFDHTNHDIKIYCVSYNQSWLK